jgi:hypothetical protein
LAIDAVLAERGISDFEKLSTVSPMEIGHWLHADALVYGEVIDYEAYYGFLIAAWRVVARVRMVSTRDGHELFACTDARYSTNLTPAIDPIDIGISSVLNLFDLRDITLARARVRGRQRNRPEASCGRAQCIRFQDRSGRSRRIALTSGSSPKARPRP